MKDSIKVLVSLCVFGFSFQCPANMKSMDKDFHSVDLPFSLHLALRDVHRTARNSDIRNLFMFNYTYYANGFCKDQDCSEQKIKIEKASAREKMGDDFNKFEPHEGRYREAISFLQSRLKLGDLSSLHGQRSYLHIDRVGIYVSCVDFAKAVMGKAIEYGFPGEQLFLYVTMAEEGYKKMCPAADGSRPVLPRPLVHTLIAYQWKNKWYALNVEDPETQPLNLGSTLSKRLEIKHQFTFPALVAYQKLIYAGAFPAHKFINGYPWSWLVSITAAGKLELDPSSVKCE